MGPKATARGQQARFRDRSEAIKVPPEKGLGVAQHVSARMRAVRSSNTGPERAVASALRKEGIRFRRQVRRAGVRLDFLLTDSRTALFVDGCFWHGCPRHRVLSDSSTVFWFEKIAANKRRDRRNDRSLRAAGYHVIRIWEHEVLRSLNHLLARLEAKEVPKRALAGINKASISHLSRRHTRSARD